LGGGEVSGTSSSVRGDTVVLQWCYSGVLVMLQGPYSGITVMLQWCHSGFTGVVSQGRVVQSNKVGIAGS
jgi:hypothetical protein